jgi:hypothetical protein
LPLNIKKGRWCPICSLPFSEKVVWDYLLDHKINTDVQYKFDNLQGNNGTFLKYDFAIFDKNNCLYCLIEIDDCEHRYNTKQEYRIKARERDRIKDKYCLSNNIRLYRIPYEYKNKTVTYEEYYSYLETQLYPIIQPLIKHREVG